MLKTSSNNTPHPYTTNSFTKKTLFIGAVIGEGVSKYIIKNIGRSLGSSMARYTIKNKEINELNKKINSLEKELGNKNKTYYQIFSNSLHKISGNIQDTLLPSLHISKNFMQNHPALSVIGGGSILYGLYHILQKRKKNRSLPSNLPPK